MTDARRKRLSLSARPEVPQVRGIRRAHRGAVVNRGAVVIGAALVAGCTLPAWRLPGPWWSGAETVARNPLIARAEAGQALSPPEQARLVQAIDEALTNQPSAWRRSRLVLLLGPLPSPQAAAVLHKGLSDPSPQVRMAVCQALREQPAERAIPSLAGVLSNDADLDVRLEAARSLGHFQGGQAVLALAAALDDADPAVQYRVMQSLQDSSGQDFGNDLAEWKQFAAHVMMDSGSAVTQAPASPGASRR